MSDAPVSIDWSVSSSSVRDDDVEATAESNSAPVRVVEGEAQILTVWSRPQEMSRRWREPLSLGMAGMTRNERGDRQSLIGCTREGETHAEKQRPFT